MKIQKDTEKTSQEFLKVIARLKSKIARLEKSNDEVEKSKYELQQSKNTAEKYLGIAAEIIISLNTKGNITVLNESGHKLLGYNNGELIGKNWFVTCLPANVRKEVSAVFQKLMQGDVENVENYENTIITQNGEKRIIYWYNTLLKNTDDNIIGILSSGVDITIRKQAEQALIDSEAKFRGLFDSSSDAIHLMDGDKFIDSNIKATQMYGYKSKEDMLGGTPLDISPERQPDNQLSSEKANLYIQEALSGKPQKFYWKHKRHDTGKLFDVEVMLSNIILENKKYLIAIGRDITERKQGEEKLENYREHLEELVKELTKELEGFSYSISHDMRTPLRAITGFSEILWDEYNDKLDAEANRLINIIRKNTLNMNQLITDLLDFSRLGRRQVRLVKIYMKNLAQDVFNELRQEYPKREIKFNLGEIPSATGDKKLMRLVFTNLISNALKFSESKKVIEIEIGFRIKNKQAFYCVKDNGVGFDMKYVDKIFGVFQRLHSSKEFEGTGVGLAIVQRIIQKHGGKMMIEGEVDKGATIYFSLPKIEHG